MLDATAYGYEKVVGRSIEVPAHALSNDEDTG